MISQKVQKNSSFITIFCTYLKKKWDAENTKETIKIYSFEDETKKLQSTKNTKRDLDVLLSVSTV